MEGESPAHSVDTPCQTSNFDELFMQHAFSHSLKDMKNIRKQLYSAAEYFELSYHKNDHKQLVVETLKDYVTKALVSTVDHLGSVADKVNNFLEEKFDEISVMKLRLSCIQQRLRTCQEFIDQQGHLQQSFVIRTPKYHKRYIVPGSVGDSRLAINESTRTYSSCITPDNDDCAAKAVLATTMKHPTPNFRENASREGNSKMPSAESLSTSPGSGLFTFINSSSIKESGKRSISPLCFSLVRSGSVIKGSISPISSSSKKRWSSEPRRSVSMCIHPETDRRKGFEQYSKKNKRLFKALLSGFQERTMSQADSRMTFDQTKKY